MKLSLNKITIGAIVILVLLFGAAIFSRPSKSAGLAIENTPSLFYYVATSSAVSVGNISTPIASSTVVLPASSGRIWAIISANSQALYCNYQGFIGTSSVPTILPSSTNGFIIATSTVWTINLTNGIFTGPVICTAYGTTTAFVEVNQ